MEKGQIFTATDKYKRTLRYKYLGENPQLNGYNIELLNLDWNESTFVELEWFNQRKIKLIDPKKELIENLNKGDNVLIKYDEEYNKLSLVLEVKKDRIKFKDSNSVFEFTKKYLLNSNLQLELIADL